MLDRGRVAAGSSRPRAPQARRAAGPRRLSVPRIAVIGAIATDHLMTFPGRFTDLLLPDRLDALSLSFLVDTFSIRRGGAAANLSFGLGVLGGNPLLIGAAGHDMSDYGSWLQEHGVDTGGVRILTGLPTARTVALTDEEENRITSFHPGAMAESGSIELRGLTGPGTGVRLAVIAQGDPTAMTAHTRQCRDIGLPFAATPSAGPASLTRSEARGLVDGARWLFTDAREAALLQEATGWRAPEILTRVGGWVTTLGADGVRIAVAGEPEQMVPAVPDAEVRDPAGAGDAFRAGFLTGLGWGRSPVAAARLGCALAAASLAGVGPQDYEVRPRPLLTSLARAYGRPAAQEFSPALRLLDTSAHWSPSPHGPCRTAV